MTSKINSFLQYGTDKQDTDVHLHFFTFAQTVLLVYYFATYRHVTFADCVEFIPLQPRKKLLEISFGLQK